MTFEKVRQVLDSFVQEGIPGVDCIITVDHQEVFRHITDYAFQRRLRNALYQDLQERVTV